MFLSFVSVMSGLLLIPSDAASQLSGCFGETFTTQSEIDAFNPLCAVMLGDLIISSDFAATTVTSEELIRDLTPLRNLTNADNLLVIGNPELRTLTGLRVKSVDQCVAIMNNPKLRDLNGLSNLKSIADGGSSDAHHYLCDDRGLTIENNPELTTLTDLIALRGIGNYLRIESNRKLQSLLGLFNVTEKLDALTIKNNRKLTTLSGLRGITQALALVVEDNETLRHLNDLRFLRWTSLTRSQNYLSLSRNASLYDCDGLAAPLNWVYRAPQIEDSRLFINNNRAGCNSLSDIYDGVFGPTMPSVTSSIAENGRAVINILPGEGRDAIYPVTGHSLVCSAEAIEGRGSVAVLDNAEVVGVSRVSGYRGSRSSSKSATFTYAVPYIFLDHPQTDQVRISVKYPWRSDRDVLIDREASAGGVSYPNDIQTTLVDHLFLADTKTSSGDYEFFFSDQAAGAEGTAEYYVYSATFAIAGSGASLSNPPVLTGTAFEIDVLENSVQYACQLQAISPPLQTDAELIFPLSAVLTAAPQAPAVEVSSGQDYGSLIIDPEAVSRVGEEIERYQVSCVGSDGEYVEVTDSLIDDVVLDDMDPGAEYSCRARAYNRLGWGAWSPFILAATEAPTGLPIWLLYQATQ
jgi:hypothetical protein